MRWGSQRNQKSNPSNPAFASASRDTAAAASASAASLRSACSLRADITDISSWRAAPSCLPPSCPEGCSFLAALSCPAVPCSATSEARQKRCIRLHQAKGCLGFRTTTGALADSAILMLENQTKPRMISASAQKSLSKHRKSCKLHCD